jgi:hypothetical protein
MSTRSPSLSVLSAYPIMFLDMMYLKNRRVECNYPAEQNGGLFGLLDIIITEHVFGAFRVDIPIL